MKTVLVVDDKEMMRDSVSSTLQRAGFSVTTADGGEAALRAVLAKRPDVIVSDLKMPDVTGIELLERVREIDADLPVLLMTAFGTIETAVQAMKLGAFDYVTKPFQGDEIVIAVKRACRHADLVRENALLRASAPVSEQPRAGDAGHSEIRRGVDRLLGGSSGMRRVREQVSAVADTQGTVLIVGESGAGKEVVARAIHESSGRSGEPFLAVNCAALSESLLESELFGHERGAFTGADKLRKGRFELADRGTLLLDEVSEIAPSLQAKLLRVLQERSFERVGSSVTIGVDVRVIATSNRDLPRSVSQGSFRQDLFFRLNVLPVHLPPLRERLDDVGDLAQHFVAEICRREGLSAMAIEDAALGLLAAYSWPGNVRELQNICERAVVLGRASRRAMIDAGLIEPWLGVGVPESTTAEVRVDREAASAFVNGVGRATAMPSNGQATRHAPAYGPMAAETHGSSHAAAVNGLAVERAPTDLRDLAHKPVTLEEIEREAIVTTLTRFNGHRQKTAKSLGIGVRTLGLKLKKWKQEELVPQTL